MRYYTVSFLDASGNPLSLGNGQPNSFTSYVNGKNIMGALDIEFDIYSFTYDVLPDNKSYIRLWGVGLPLLGQANNLYGKTVTLQAGMKQGLPLANPAQAGLILQANIWQAFGNWQDTEQTSDLILQSGPPATVNIPFTWTKGQPIGDAIKNALSVAYPTSKINVNITASIIAAETQSAHYQTLGAFAQAVTEYSKAAVGGGYNGLFIYWNGLTINVFDKTESSVAIAFTDLIGQPTWNSLTEITIKTVLRADLNVGSLITLPQTVVTTQAASLSNFRNQLDFSGSFMVSALRHVGHYKQNDANSWVTVITAILQTNV